MFGRKSQDDEEWRVQVTIAFTDTYVGKGGDDWEREVPIGSTGKASISKNGNIKVTFDTLRDLPHIGPLQVYFKKSESLYNNFKWVSKTKGESVETKIKKSSVFSG